MTGRITEEMGHLAEELKEAEKRRESKMLWGALIGFVLGFLYGFDFVFGVLGGVGIGAIVYWLCSGEVNKLKAVQGGKQ